ncbi:hypothetical protein ACU5JM_19470 [Rhodococcus erythropolis]|uniref:hypothetical protein n=1 Tax=Rhodococcus erythropolis TaxID=1833 RepID=UPI00406BBC30
MEIEDARLEVDQRVVARLWNWTPDALRDNARKGFKAEVAEGLDPTGYAVSVFAKTRAPGESISTFLDRVCEEIREHRVAKWVALVPEQELADAGFQIDLNEPPKDHYDIPVGSEEDNLRVDDLSRVFGTYNRRRMPK